MLPLMRLAVTVYACAAAPALAQTHPPDIEARLSQSIGDWTIPGQERTYRETCEWYGPKAFVVCNSSDSSDGSMGVSILGYSRARERFTYHNYSGSGSSRSEFGFPHGTSGIVYTDERQMKDGLARTTTWLEPQPDGRLHFRRARSVNGGPWEQDLDFFYVRRAK